MPGGGGETESSHELVREVLDVVQREEGSALVDLGINSFRRIRETKKLHLIGVSTRTGYPDARTPVRLLVPIVMHIVVGPLEENLSQYSTAFQDLINRMRNTDESSHFLLADVKRHEWVRSSPNKREGKQFTYLQFLISQLNIIFKLQIHTSDH